jgi:predicted nucleotide-binding protein
MGRCSLQTLATSIEEARYRMKTNLNKRITDRLKEFIEAEIDNPASVSRWSLQVSEFLTTVLGDDEAGYFLNLSDPNEYDQHARRIGHLQGLIDRAEAAEPPAESVKDKFLGSATSSIGIAGSRKVFVVHGRDNAAKESTARFLEKLRLQAVILHEQPSSGRTIIEKFENYSEDVGFAVVLLTPDDIGGINAKAHELNPRARQNVILELGYFIGRLGRTNVCALYKGGIELPSDYQGVVYIEMDDHDAWKTKLAQELVQAKVPIDLSGLICG